MISGDLLVELLGELVNFTLGVFVVISILPKVDGSEGLA